MKRKLRAFISCFLYAVALFSFLGAITATSGGSMLDFSDLARLIFCGLAEQELQVAPMTPADNPEDWIYRITYNPVEKVPNGEEIIVSVHEKYLEIGNEYYLPKDDVDFDSILEWFHGKAAYFFG